MNCPACGKYVRKMGSFEEGPDEYAEWKCSSCGYTKLELLRYT